ncbi:MAG: hypothetical protein JNL61_11385 [Rhizobiaceae bacterium]|nr:hypothetical protein [Rhizobiaceae bacterium]
MINWLIDRVWARKNAAALQAIDAQMDALRAEGERLHHKMVEMFGPNYREDAERRFQKRLSGDWTTV